MPTRERLAGYVRRIEAMWQGIKLVYRMALDLRRYYREHPDNQR